MTSALLTTEAFQDRHLGTAPADRAAMLQALGYPTLQALIEAVIPATIRSGHTLNLPPAEDEPAVLERLKSLAAQNEVYRSYIGQGYYGTHTPTVILRNILENPGWYTQYTPYQAEIAQGRLEMLLNFQTLVTDLTGLAIANASLLDEGTAAAEAMQLAHAVTRTKQLGDAFFVDHGVHPQTLAVLTTRAEPLGIELVVGDYQETGFDKSFFGALVQYPTSEGSVEDYRALTDQLHAHGALVIAATDLLALTLLTPPGDWGADVAIGSAQRFGVPMGYGGPHAAFFATQEAYKRLLPGRLIGVSLDAQGNTAYRLALQTREQHIRREKATSNICTAQVLLANIAAAYAIYHGPEGLRRIAQRVHAQAVTLGAGLKQLGFYVRHTHYFDTLTVELGDNAQNRQQQLRQAALAAHVNFAYNDDGSVGISLDETVRLTDLQAILAVFAQVSGAGDRRVDLLPLANRLSFDFPEPFARQSSYLRHPVFHQYHTEHELLRYLKRLENKDLSLAHSMIPLGSCTMKLNATTEMVPVTFPAFGNLHPFVPAAQAQGYHQLFTELEAYLSEITGFAAVSLQPNSGAQGEYTGLMVIRAYHRARGEGHRNVALIPASAHGTNPASAVMAGMQVVVVGTDANGNIDLADLTAKAEQHSAHLAALMITYPSTHGVFEAAVRDICALIHRHGGQVYMDGANLNAQVGLTSPGFLGADVCHLNLHKTFCIPHGGGGPGMGPIGVAAHLAPFLPQHPLVKTGGEAGISPVSAAPWGSASILLISYTYIRLMGGVGLTEATRNAILNANYIQHRLAPHYPVLYTGENGRVAHELILDLRPFKQSAGVEVEDVAKRLMDYGFHAPTVSFPVAGTLMIEPTESESLAELERFCEAMIAIRAEIQAIAEGRADAKDNVLKNAPHTQAMALADSWSHPYTREQAVFPLPWVRERKFWPSVARVDSTYGDRNLVCTCPDVESYAAASAAPALATA